MRLAIASSWLAPVPGRRGSRRGTRSPRAGAACPAITPRNAKSSAVYAASDSFSPTRAPPPARRGPNRVEIVDVGRRARGAGAEARTACSPPIDLPIPARRGTRRRRAPPIPAGNPCAFRPHTVVARNEHHAGALDREQPGDIDRPRPGPRGRAAADQLRELLRGAAIVVRRAVEAVTRSTPGRAGRRARAKGQPDGDHHQRRLSSGARSSSVMGWSRQLERGPGHAEMGKRHVDVRQHRQEQPEQHDRGRTPNPASTRGEKAHRRSPSRRSRSSRQWRSPTDACR